MTRVAIVGATGYAGGELAALLSRHSEVSLTGVYGGPGRAESRPFATLHPSLRGRSGPDVRALTLDALLADSPQAVFLATPAETSLEVVPELMANGITVIDLSAAYRIRNAADYPAWYGFPHSSPALLASAVYGLTEWCNGELRDAKLVANPGCYPTAILLALKPIAHLLAPGIICDAKSGVSGAGRKSEAAYSFTELAGNFKAYGVGTHRHTPEIQQGIGDGLAMDFVPHLLPTIRGILATLYVSFNKPVSSDELASAYSSAYANSPFVIVRKPGELPELKDVVATPRAEIGFQLLGGAQHKAASSSGQRAVIVSVIDNLLKGAASQAVQNFNRVFGFDEQEGLQ
ncbi:MAG TPA: N-acetyl-gamma-glutamyl-phosphate reductase [Thermoanaerobaculia bacterium]|nr:N-acetyl-gamma-glutamyl-phosphate reductase [Thermoanaerobaculia bacterium]